VQGQQLSCVIIDRLPFAVPSDPVVAARVKSIDAEGGNAFFQYQVPAAVITLKTRLRTSDPVAARPRPAHTARQSHSQEGLRTHVRGESASLSPDHRPT